MEKELKTIHELGLHEALTITGITIIRVPGGWIYTNCYDSNIVLTKSGYFFVFVPFDNEFKAEALEHKIEKLNE